MPKRAIRPGPTGQTGCAWWATTEAQRVGMAKTRKRASDVIEQTSRPLPTITATKWAAVAALSLPLPIDFCSLVAAAVHAYRYSSLCVPTQGGILHGQERDRETHALLCAQARKTRSNHLASHTLLYSLFSPCIHLTICTLQGGVAGLSRVRPAFA